MKNEALADLVDLIVKYQRLAENESARYMRASDVVKDLDKVLSLMLGSLDSSEPSEPSEPGGRPDWVQSVIEPES